MAMRASLPPGRARTTACFPVPAGMTTRHLSTEWSALVRFAPMSSSQVRLSSTNASGFAPRSPVKNRKLLPAILAGTVVLGGLLTWMLLRNRIPAPDADTASVAKFVNKAQFASLPEEQQRPYLKALEKS